MTERKSQPELIRVVWMVIKKLNSDKTPTSLKNVLFLLSNEKKLNPEYLEKEIVKAVDDGLIVSSKKAGTPTRVLFQIPKLDEAERQRLDRNSDWYCYFCHTGENLINCARCPRVVHRLCASQNDEETVEDQPEPSTSSAIRTVTENNPEAVPRIDSRDHNDDVCVDDTWLPYVVLKKEAMKEETDADEPKPFDEDCQFISVLRPPNKRKTQDIKDVIVLDQDEPINPSDNGLAKSARINVNQSNEIMCQYCKLLSTSDISQEPNISAAELNNLLGFLYERIKPWINFAASPLSKLYSKEFQETFKLLFLKFPVTLDSIKSKLSTNSYKTLDEFYCDILDFHHGVAIIFGTTSKEYYTSQQTLLECSYHISEIRSCHDCYRHSNHLKSRSKLWFTEPCTIRHEPVFAKQIGFPYWPAKVLKVSDDDYDVRFFGSKHTRAIVKSNYIKPIDTTLEELKISKKSTGFVKAMEELEIYQQRRMSNFNEDYSNISNNNISFQLDATTISNYNTSEIMVDNSLERSINISPASKTSDSSNSKITKANLRSGSKNKKETPDNQNKLTNGQRLGKHRSPPILVLNTKNSIKSININKNCKQTLDNIRTQLNAIPMEIETRKQMLNSVEQEVKNLAVDFKNLLREVKKGEWCYVCGKIGKYYCCKSMFYCSNECQYKHWDEEHAQNCRKFIEPEETV